MVDSSKYVQDYLMYIVHSHYLDKLNDAMFRSDAHINIAVSTDSAEKKVTFTLDVTRGGKAVYKKVTTNYATLMSDKVMATVALVL